MGRPDCTITPMCRAWGGFALAAALLASAPTDVTAQVFVAASPRPDFTIGPVFVGATAPADLAAPVNVSVTWNLVPLRGERPSPQRLALLWRNQSQLGLLTPADELPVTASYVSFVRRDAPPQAGTGSLVWIPATPHLGDSRWVLTLPFPVRGMIAPKPA